MIIAVGEFLRRFFFVAALLTPMLAAGAALDALPDGGRGLVATVVDGDTLRLQGGEADIRLLAIQAPKLPLGRTGFRTWPLAHESRAALVDLVKGHSVTLRLGTTPQDRNGRILAHVVRDDGLWIQAELLRQGWARVYTFPDNRQFTAELFAAEREARAARRGMWAHAAYSVRAPDPAKLKNDIGTFQIVEGRVVNAAKIRGRVYLNFGADFLTDFTATIPPDAVPLFTRATFDPLTLKDKFIRVRGYLRDYLGPVMDVTHPEQIETESGP